MANMNLGVVVFLILAAISIFGYLVSARAAERLNRDDRSDDRLSDRQPVPQRMATEPRQQV